jgi:hypothetical protein
MAVSTPLVINFTVTAPTVPEANAKLKQGTLDCLKQNLGSLNAELGRRNQLGTPPVPKTVADIDAASNATLTTWMQIVVRAFAAESVKAWRTKAADAQFVEPVRVAVPDYDEAV